MKIISLKSQNVLRLDAVEITPDGNLIVIGGENAQGKTSVLDSILLAMGGKKAKHQEPLKQGKKKGKVTVDIGDFTITRTFTQKGGSLKVINNNDDNVYSSPQKMLDELVGQLTFDPLQWTQMANKAQLDTLKSLIGLDFDELDAKRTELYTERTDINREVKRLEGVVQSSKEHDAPLVEVSVAELMEDLQQSQEVINDRANDEREIIRLKEAYKERKRNITDWKMFIAKAEDEMDSLKQVGQNLQAKIDAQDIPDIESIQRQITDADETNANIRSNLVLRENKSELKATRKDSEKISDKISAIDTKKAEALTSAKFPVKGLSFDEDGVLYNGVPFSQASSAEKLRVSIAMGIALNPDLKVLLIRDGSLLDDTNLATVAKMADDAECQIWLERVSSDGEGCTVMIEDGNIKEG